MAGCVTDRPESFAPRLTQALRATPGTGPRRSAQVVSLTIFVRLPTNRCRTNSFGKIADPSGDRERAAACRRLVILAKDHARWELRSPKTSPAKKAEKEEMILWLLTWLENPGVFESWLRLRKLAGPMEERREGDPPA